MQNVKGGYFYADAKVSKLSKGRMRAHPYTHDNHPTKECFQAQPRQTIDLIFNFRFILKTKTMHRPLFCLLSVLCLTLLTAPACQSDDEEGPRDPNRVTTLVLTFTDGDGQTILFLGSDPDGAGGDEPATDDIELDADADYTVGLALLDESGPNPRIRTEAVRAEAEKYLVCYETTGDLPEPVLQDTDANGDPLGLTATLSTGNPGTGTLRVILKYEPDKGVTDPCTTGETSVDQVFDVTVQ